MPTTVRITISYPSILFCIVHSKRNYICRIFCKYATRIKRPIINQVWQFSIINPVHSKINRIGSQRSTFIHNETSSKTSICLITRLNKYFFAREIVVYVKNSRVADINIGVVRDIEVGRIGILINSNMSFVTFYQKCIGCRIILAKN